jgi:hypothetical protein
MHTLLVLSVSIFAVPALAQRIAGEIRIQVNDGSGLPLRARVELNSNVTQVERVVEADSQGSAALSGLPFGLYQLSVTHGNFAPHTSAVEVRSELPLRINVTLQVTGPATIVEVRESPALLDARATGPVSYIGRDAISTRRAAAPSRSLVELIESQPGWLLEANGVLHPRGSEYNVQYVVDGTPLADNRSPAFAPPLGAEEVEYVRILTGNYPAEFGRKLGGVVEVVRERPAAPGAHVRAVVQAGSFDTRSAYTALDFKRGQTSAALSMDVAQTDRYLDPPTPENFTNRGSLGGVVARVEHSLRERDRVRALMSRRRTAFIIPNEASQQEAGQRQDRANRETMLQAAWERVLTASALLHVRGTIRDLSAELWSNPFSMPIIAEQNRGFRESYAQTSLAVHAGRHEWKTGGEFITAGVRERFAYQITDPEQFDDEVVPAFSFRDRARSKEAAAYVQDAIHAGPWSVSAGLRWDRYRFLTHDSAVSPRVGLAWNWPAADLVLRASWDRTFEVPAVENLLLSSSPAVQELTPHTTGLPVPPSRGNFWQAGFTKAVAGRMRIGGVWFTRGSSNFADDAVLLNTGVSFPIAFARAHIHGLEVKLELPRIGRASGFVSWSNLSGTGELPITGGLFLENAAELLASTTRFAITQDQRNTVHSRFRYELAKWFWAAGGLRYGSGPPVEIEGEFDPARHDPRVLARVDRERGRVRPGYFVDAAVGAQFRLRDSGVVRIQTDLVNMTDQLKVINFAGLFSGTAIAPPRSWAVRLSWSN